MGNKTETEKKPKRKIWAVINAVIVVSLVCVTLGYQMTAAKDLGIEQGDNAQNVEERGRQNKTAEAENLALGSENAFTEEGTTSMGTISQLPEFSVTTAFMYVEEVYVEAGSTVAKGDALFKITADSMAEAKAYYEKRIASAKDYLNEVQLAYESGELEASYVKLETESTAAGAAATLESSLQEIEDDLESKYEKWQEAVSKISFYRDNLYNNVYYLGAGVGEKTEALTTAQEKATTAQTEYETAAAAYQTAEAQFENAMATVNGLVSGTITEADGLTMESAAANMLSCYEVMESAKAVYDEKRTANEQAAQEVQKAEQALEQAKLTYEKNEEQAKNSLAQYEESVDSLKQNYETASAEAETKRLEVQKQYETAVLEGEYAETNYDTTVETLQSSVETAQKTLEDLLEAQEALFALEDGVVLAEQAGTIAAVNYEAGDILFSGVAFVTYYDTTTLTISVEVEQENIAKIAVGDEVSVSISGNRRGNVTGTVASVASSATTGRSVSDVTYAVVISVDNSENALSAGSSATVIFEYGE